MNARLEKALDAVRKLPEWRQEELATVLEAAVREAAVREPADPFTAEQQQLIHEGIADADAGRFATDEEVEELFNRFGRA